MTVHKELEEIIEDKEPCMDAISTSCWQWAKYFSSKPHGVWLVMK